MSIDLPESVLFRQLTIGADSESKNFAKKIGILGY
jgi:hypothetical protein